MRAWLRGKVGVWLFGPDWSAVADEVRRHEQTKVSLGWEIQKRDAEISALKAQIEMLAAVNAASLDWVEACRAKFAADVVRASVPQ
jgi:hypothetical protein